MATTTGFTLLPPFSNGMSANLVDEPDFYSRNQFLYNNAETLNSPSAIAFDSQDNLWVLAADRGSAGRSPIWAPI